VGSVANDSHRPVSVQVMPIRRSDYDLEVRTGGSSWAWVVEAAGSVDLLTASELADHLGAALAERTALIVVDLRRVGFLAAAGMRVLASADRRARAQGMTLLVVAGTHAVRRALTVVGLTPTPRVCSAPEHETVHSGL
jgi:anti-sigma B factor antagonist